MAKKFKCDICGKSYTSERGLHVHMSQKHPDKKKTEKEEKGPIENILDIKLIKNPWKIFSFVLIILLALTLVSFSSPSQTGLTKEEAGKKAVDYISNLPQMQVQGVNVSLGDTKETESGVYKVGIKITSPRDEQEINSYITKDAKYLFPQGIDITQNQEQTQNQKTKTTSKQTEEIPKSDKPKVELFVMSFCPYGNQAENTMYPVYKSLKNQVDWNIHYIVSGSKGNFKSLHGQEEVDQDIRELCVLNESGMDKWWEFVIYVNNNCGSDGICWKEAAQNAGLDVNKIKTCVDEKDADLLTKEVKATQESGATGSPTLFINGKKSRTVYDYGNSDSYKQTICSAFTQPPSECEQDLGSSSSTSSNTPAAQC